MSLFSFGFFASSSEMVANIETGITDGFTELSTILIPAIPVLIAVGFAFWAIRIIRKKIKV